MGYFSSWVGGAGTQRRPGTGALADGSGTAPGLDRTDPGYDQEAQKHRLVDEVDEERMPA
jgi:hypothetical protein